MHKIFRVLLVVAVLIICTFPDHMKVELENSSNKYVYIDSVPQGADVYLYSTKDLNRPLGSTPLVLEASRYSDKRFLILMQIKSYIEKVRYISAMQDWISELSKNSLGESQTDYHGFYFGFSEVVKIISNDNMCFLAIGPICDLQWPIQKRLCILYYPQTVKLSEFYSLMPKPRTYILPKNNWQNKLKKNGFSDQKIIEAKDCLIRCGSYFTGIKNLLDPDKTTYFSITLQDRTSGILIFQQW